MRSNLFRLKQRPGRRLAAYRPTLELLEDRRVPAVLTQTGVILPHRPTAPGLTLALATASDADGDGIVQQADVTVVGRSVQRARVRLDADGDGAFDQQTSADKKGRFKFDVVVANGVTPLRVLAASDGRKWTAELFVTGRLNHSALLDDPQQLAWQFDKLGHVADLEVLVRAIAPGNVFSQTGSHRVSPGSLPATGDVFYLLPDNTWSVDETTYATGQASGRPILDLPNGTEGEWRLEALARDASTGQITAIQGQSVFVSDHPGIHLKVNRTLANTNDPIHAELLTSAGRLPQDVRLLASLESPDGQRVSLPNFTAGLDFLHEGPSRDGQYALLDRPLFDPGVYRLRVRLLDATTDSLLSLADAEITIADAPGAMTGIVRDYLGQPLDGVSARLASVRALDVDDQTVTSQAGVGADGSYQLTLDPGRYLLSATVLDAEGRLHRAQSHDLTVVGTDGAAVSVDLTAATPTAFALADVAALTALATPSPSAPSPAAEHGLRAVAAATSSARKPNVVIVSSIMGVKPGLASLLDDVLQADLARHEPLVNFLTRQDIAALVGWSMERIKVDIDVNLSELLGNLGSDFAIIVGYGRIQTRQPKQQKVTATVISTRARGSLDRVESVKGVIDDAAFLDQVEEVAQRIGRGLFNRIDPVRNRPLQPTLSLRLDHNAPLNPGQPFTATLTLTDGPLSSGVAVKDEPVHIEHVLPSGVLYPIDGRTDADGKITLTNLSPGNVPGEGKLQAFFRRDGKFADSPLVRYQILDTSKPLILQAFRSELSAGESSEVLVTLRDQGRPVTGADVTLTGIGGAVSVPSVRTDTTGHAVFQFTADDRNGLKHAVARTILPGGPGLPGDTVTAQATFFVTGRLAVGITGQAGQQQIQTLSLGSQSAEIQADESLVVRGGFASILADLSVGGDRFPNLPLQFALQGAGQISATNSQTDGFGTVETLFVPPDASGTSVITATATVNGETVTRSLTINYEPLPPVQVFVNPGTVTLPPGATQQFTAQVLHALDRNVTWTATGGTIDNNGLFTAGSTAGSYTITATSAADPSKTAVATVVLKDVPANVDFVGFYSSGFTGYRVQVVPGPAGGAQYRVTVIAPFTTTPLDRFEGNLNGSSFSGPSIGFTVNLGPPDFRDVTFEPTGFSLNATLAGNVLTGTITQDGAVFHSFTVTK